jgi:putative spermidine/putrescine transport system permease protein
MRLGRLDLLTLSVHGMLVLVGLYVMAPIVLVVIDSFSPSTFGQFPPPGFTLRWYANALFEVPEFRRGLANSLVVATGATALALPFGTLAAYGLVRRHFRFQEVARTLLLLPITMPSVVFGVAFFLLYIRVGLYGTLPGLIVAHALLGLPFVVTVVTASLRTLGREYEEAAMDLGANPVTTFLAVVVPLIRPGLIVSAIFAFVISFDQVDVSLFLVRPATNTLPIEMFIYAGNNQDPTLSAVSAIMIVVTAIFVGVGGLLLRTQEYRRFLDRR